LFAAVQRIKANSTNNIRKLAENSRSRSPANAPVAPRARSAWIEAVLARASASMSVPTGSRSSQSM
jgi:hypothetical protein